MWLQWDLFHLTPIGAEFGANSPAPGLGGIIGQQEVLSFFFYFFLTGRRVINPSGPTEEVGTEHLLFRVTISVQGDVVGFVGAELALLI